MKYSLTILAFFMLVSCSESDPNDGQYVYPILEFVQGPNDLIYDADGSTYTDEVTIQITNSDQFPANSIIKINIAVDQENSTAIEAVDYNFSSGIYTFSGENNFIQTIPIEIISSVTYTSYSKDLAFIATIANTGFEARETFTIEFRCFTDLTGEYYVTNDFCIPFPTNLFQSTITSRDDGRWHLTIADGHFVLGCTNTIGIRNYGNIEVNCSIVEFSNDLAFVFDYSEIGTILGGSWNQESGVLIMRHRDTHFAGGPYYWTSTYTRQ